MCYFIVWDYFEGTLAPTFNDCKFIHWKTRHNIAKTKTSFCIFSVKVMNASM